MSKTFVGACLAVAFTVAAGAQDKSTMSKMDHMATEKTYSGCIESSQAGSYSLTHVMAAVKKKAMKKPEMEKDAMAPALLDLSAAHLDLSRYVGHKVSITGSDGDSMNGMTTFKVRALKSIAVSCF